VLALVDEQPIIAVQSEIPFFRDVVLGMTGRDVDSLQRALQRIGLLGEPLESGVFGHRTQAALDGLHAQVGVRRGSMRGPE